MAAIFGDPKPIFSGSDVLPQVKNMFYPLVNVYITMENNHFSGKIDYTWACSIAMLNYQRVTWVSCNFFLVMFVFL